MSFSLTGNHPFVDLGFALLLLSESTCLHVPLPLRLTWRVAWHCPAPRFSDRTRRLGGCCRWAREMVFVLLWDVITTHPSNPCGCMLGPFNLLSSQIVPVDSSFISDNFNLGSIPGCATIIDQRVHVYLFGLLFRPDTKHVVSFPTLILSPFSDTKWVSHNWFQFLH